MASSSPLILALGGVGSGKTYGLGAMCLRGMAEQPGCESAIFAPSYRLFRRVTLPSIKRVVPNELFTFHPGSQEIHWANGAVTYCMGVDRTPEDRILGMNLAWAVWDEAGVTRNANIVGLISERLRVGDPELRFLALFTSPHGHGWLEDWSAADVDVVHASTYDNPHLDDTYIALLEREYPPGSLIWRQELGGELISLTGKMYGDVFSRVEHTDTWMSSRQNRGAWVLSVDPGYRASAWLAWERTPGGPWVVTREWLPEAEMTEVTAKRIKHEMGSTPVKVLMDTPSKSARLHVDDQQAIRDVFKRCKEVRVLGREERKPRFRHKSVIAGLRSGTLKISAELCPSRISKDERGLVYSLETLEWKKSTTRSEKQDDDDPRKHVLDALEFGAVVLTPAKLARSEDRLKYYQQRKTAA